MRSRTRSSDENRDDRKCRKRREVDGSRNGVTGFTIPANRQAPNPKHDRELDQES